MSRIVLLVLCICALAAPVLAQNQQPTRSPDQGFISGWQNEVIFPQAIRFSLTLGMPASGLAAATLTIQPAGQVPIAIDVNIQDSAAVSQPYTELAYIWPIPRDLPPRLFRDITMSWQVTSVNNEIARVQDTFQFTDQRVQWARALDSRLTIATPADGPDPSRLQQAMQPVYDLLSANTGQSPSLQVILYPRTLRPAGCSNNSAGESVAAGPASGVEVQCDPTMADAVFAASDVSALQSRPGPNGDVEAVATFLTDSFYDPVWQGKDLPAWFRAGLEQFYTPTLKTTLLPLLMEASRNNRLLSLNQLRTLPSSSVDIWYAQSYAMVLYIANQFGVSSLYQLAREIGAAESFTDAFESVTQFKYPALLPNVERWLFENSTPSAFAFTPYQASTPTPTPSLSPTPFPPTITPTPTVTPTITATPTVTGVLSATPLPTRTLTPVPTQAPPSVTPRQIHGTELPTPVPLSSRTTPVPLPAPPTPLPVERIPGLVVVIVLAVAIVILMYRRFRPPI